MHKTKYCKKVELQLNACNHLREFENTSNYLGTKSVNSTEVVTKLG
jgi:hypothetical protein